MMAEEVSTQDDRPGSFYDYVSYLDKNNIVRINYGIFGACLAKEYGVISYKDTIYAYDYEKGIFVEAEAFLRSEIQRICMDEISYEGKIVGVKREIMSYIKDSQVVEEYPFNQFPGIPVKNGVVTIDFVTGQINLLPHSMMNKFTYQLPVRYDPEAPSEPICELLRDWVANNDGAYNALIQVPAQGLYQAMFPGVMFKKAYLLHGDAHAGKSTYLTLLDHIIGVDNQSSVSLHGLADDPFALSTMVGKIINRYDDLSSVGVGHMERFKTLTGYDKHEVNEKNKPRYLARIFATHVFTCNRTPEVTDVLSEDNAFWERWEYITFPNSYPVDPTFYEKTFTDINISGFFNVVLKFILEIGQKKSLIVTSDSVEVKEAWTANSNLLSEFIQRNTIIVEKGSIPIGDLFGQYMKFRDKYSGNKNGSPDNNSGFGKKIRMIYGFNKEKKSVGGIRREHYTGLDWRPGGAYSLK